VAYLGNFNYLTGEQNGIQIGMQKGIQKRIQQGRHEGMILGALISGKTPEEVSKMLLTHCHTRIFFKYFSKVALG